MPNELVHPNWHVIVIHYPIALLTLGLAVEIGAFLYRRSSFRTAGRWMLLLGALSCLPAATVGIYAYYDTIRFAGQGNSTAMEPAGEAWYQLTRQAEGHLSNEQWDDLKHHIWRAGSGTIIALFTVLLYLGLSDKWRRRFHVPCLLLMLFAVVVLMSGAWHAGESIHVRGTAIEGGASGGVFDRDHVEAAVKGIVPPLQLHVLLAGITMALALGALGLSMRALSAARGPEIAPAPRDAETHDMAYGDANAHGLEARVTVQKQMIVVPLPLVRPARFWLVACLLALGTAAAGIWVAGWSWESIKPMLAQPRDLAHMILGSSIVLLSLILAGVTHWTVGRKWTLTLLSALLVLVVGAQVWVGILMMYDGSDGGSSLVQFRRPVVQSAKSSAP